MNLIGLKTSDLEAHLKENGEAAFRGRQIADWIYKKGAADFSEMKNLSAALREKLGSNDSLDFPRVSKRTVASDGTTKLLLEMQDGERIETVRLPYPERLSVCVSSQAGCAMACQFCATGLGGFRRNLSTAEIIAQILLVKREGAERETPTHVVFMGMGEPLLNTDNVFRTVELMHDEMGIPMRHITVSTVGILNGIEKLAQKKWQLTLAVSLHAAEDELRHELIPTSGKTSVSDLVAASKNYVGQTGRRVTFEYVVLGGVNDSPKMARELARLCKGWPCHVNLIPWNDVPGAQFAGVKPDALREFRGILERAGISVTQRVQRGADVAAACGQLRALNEPIRREGVIPLSGI
ncbi:MAG: 23S rRNA (adenine(2503)-C(2))-methyltransferase RlmN [Oxalobacteraceae bacterium]|nr:MAG: 23S rRNA (adenine(2503)-C(2))-methyltransferase RlmN [Oxalobacteraceae bacterium]